MYRCCQCNHEIKWWKASSSTTIFPCKCPSCSLEQNAENSYSRKEFILFIIALPVFYFCGHVLVFGAYPKTWPYVAGLLLSIGGLIYFEWRRAKIGVLKPNDSKAKVRGRIALAIILPIIIILAGLQNKWF